MTMTTKTSSKEPTPGVCSQSPSHRTDAGFNPVSISHDQHALQSLPRVATARVPLLNKVPSEIHLNMHKKVVPKTYDDTKHFVVQKFSHGRIIDIGDQIHRLTSEASYRERETAVVEAENKVWQNAEDIRVKALHDLQVRLQSDYEDLVKRINKDHDKALKEEALRVETALRKLSLDQVKLERDEGEKKLKAAVLLVEERCKREMSEKVEQTRAEECLKAKDDVSKLEKSWSDKYTTKITQLNAEIKRELTELNDKKDWEKQEAIIQTKQKERKNAKQELENVKENYDSRIHVLNHKIREQKYDVRDNQEEKMNMEALLKDVGTELHLTRDAFRDYIHQVSSCVVGQADFQMPVSKFDHIEFNDKT